MVMRLLLNEVLVATFAAIPTVFLFFEYRRTGGIVWWLLALTMVCLLLAVAFTHRADPARNDEGVDGDEEDG
jgi:hypothetical protein